MKSDSLGKIGGLCSIAVGIAYILIGITHVLLPPGQKVGDDMAHLLTSFAESPTLLTIHYWIFALSGVIGIGAVPAIAELVREYDEGWVRWTSALAMLGFVLNMVGYFRLITFMPDLAAQFVAGDATTKQMILFAEALTAVDTQGWIRYGGTGLWIGVISLVALRAGVFPRPLAICGFFTGALYWLVLIGAILQSEPIIMVGAIFGGVIAVPIWFIWIGLRLRRSGVPLPAAPQRAPLVVKTGVEG